jgi:uroporphyrin-III C-methyltransferase/precorrin-2 dehydrogenase/sirohydrochlorin ferrochelatase
MYPVMLSVTGRRCLVVGGGGVALRKVQALVAEGAVVTVVTPAVVEPLEELARLDRIVLERRPYRPGEAAEHVLIFAATDDREVNRQVFEDADNRGVWVNVADDPELCSFHLPARLRRGALQVAVASGGEAPFVVRRLRQLLETRLGPEWAEWIDAASRFRARTRESRLEPTDQEAAFDRFFSATVEPHSLTARVPTDQEMSSWLEGAASESGTEAATETRRTAGGGQPPAERSGLVSLVGAGPGCAGLLTVRGRQRLLSADAVVYDRLAAAALPCDLAPRVELHCVGKTAGHHPVPQEEITAQLVRLAREGKRVVRLKGGDPYVFGRGGEEAEALREAGVPFEVVPGVTSGVAVPSFTGIPVTHRGEAVRLTLLTAHEAIKRKGPQVRWDLLAQDPHATLVGYMGVTTLPEVVRQLLGGGMDPETPAALVQNGTMAAQRCLTSTLAALPGEVERAGLGPPALFVIGPSVRHAKNLDWFSRQPLAGERLVVAAVAPRLAETLEAAGADVVAVPSPITPAARVVMGAHPITGCVLRMPAEVDGLEEEREGAGWEGGPVAWCLGRETARRARRLGWRRVHEGSETGEVAEIVDWIRLTRSPAG